MPDHVTQVTRESKFREFKTVTVRSRDMPKQNKKKKTKNDLVHRCLTLDWRQQPLMTEVKRIKLTVITKRSSSACRMQRNIRSQHTTDVNNAIRETLHADVSCKTRAYVGQF